MGLIKDKIYYTYEDVTIMPNVISLIEHRSECIPLDEEGMLPLFTAPMDTVVNSKNFGMFEDEMIHAILPRTESLTVRVENSIKGRWSAYSLSEFEHIFCNETEKLDEKNKIKALIDIANGHMMKSIDLVRSAKNIGVTAGASTPARIIKEVLDTMSEIKSGETNFEESFEELLEESLKN